jgi:hypothetical protein
MARTRGLQSDAEPAVGRPQVGVTVLAVLDAVAEHGADNRLLMR